MTAVPRVIAEFGQCKGSVDYAIEAVRVAAQAGAWAVKIQLLRPERIAQPHAPVYWDERRPGIDGQRDVFATAGCLPYDGLRPIVDAARAAGVKLMATPFDSEAVEAMRSAGIVWCKVASGDLPNRPLIEECAAAFPETMVLSTGAAQMDEITAAIGWMLPRAEPFAVLACTLSYPTPDAAAHISRIGTLRYHRDHLAGTWNVGYSDHTHGAGTSALAVAAGATVLEKHCTLDTTDGSVPDNAFALAPPSLRFYVQEAERAHRMLGSPVLEPVPDELPARVGARRSLCATVPLRAGDMITEPRVTALRPHHPDGFDPAELSALVGRHVTEPVGAGEPFLRFAVT